jgi:GR25 family glycosyltransferase involved in LPS biosynthesis
MIDIYYINLDQAIDRKKSLEENLSKFKDDNFTVSRINAINVNYILENNIKGSIRDSEKACFLSHMKAIESSLGNENSCFIIEDDAMFGPSANLITNLEKNVDKNIDLIFTDICIPNIHDMIDLFFLRKECVHSKKLIYLDLKKLSAFAGTSAYLIPNKSKRKVFELIQKYKKLDLPYDLFLRQCIYKNNLNGVFIFPFLTSLSNDSLLTQNQLPEEKITDLTWDTFRRLMFVDSEMIDFDFMNLLSENIEKNFYDSQSENFTKILKVIVSEKFRSK